MPTLPTLGGGKLLAVKSAELVAILRSTVCESLLGFSELPPNKSFQGTPLRSAPELGRWLCLKIGIVSCDVSAASSLAP